MNESQPKMNLLPIEIVASLLAASTLLLTLVPWNLPVWAIFISWAGTFAAGGPNPHVLRRIWATMPVGSTYAMIIVMAFEQASHSYAGYSFLVAQMVILFSLNSCLMYTARIPMFGFIPGMFFGFASYFGTVFGGFGPAPNNPSLAWVAVVPMSAIGPLFAWLSVKVSRPHKPH